MLSISFILLASTALLSTLTSATPALTPRQSNTTTPTYLCNYGDFGLKRPVPNQVIVQSVSTSYQGTDIELLYCSSEYFKTRSLGVSVGLARPESWSSAGEIIALDYKPSDGQGVAQPGYYGYLFNVTVYPISGSYPVGLRRLSVFEVASGYHNPYNYVVKTVDLNFTLV
ncbi:hypothetical protein LTS18_009044 [Coniosporium uncinatum]|uniref:Uncharacterized protein n=1 Tax=Coniosporium uncinatum TaxID=93489 RepID=A0ACC3DWY3_9PEZI|nr:hypothetical protein LTS18_009044 [Coniosporium uncinatum]